MIFIILTHFLGMNLNIIVFLIISFKLKTISKYNSVSELLVPYCAISLITGIGYHVIIAINNCFPQLLWQIYQTVRLGLYFWVRIKHDPPCMINLIKEQWVVNKKLHNYPSCLPLGRLTLVCWILYWGFVVIILQFCLYKSG